jgi:hypothetical protein
MYAEGLGNRSLGTTTEGWLRITASTHPLLFEAMDAITHDGGGGCHEHYNVPPGWAEALARMEVTLGRLSAEQQQTLAIGDCAEQGDLVQEFDGLGVVHRFLDAFFEDFSGRESIESA